MRRRRLERALDGVGLRRFAWPDAERRRGMVGDDVVARPGRQQGEVDRQPLAIMRELLVRLELVEQLDRGVAPVLRRDPGVGRLADDIDREHRRPLAPHGDLVGRVAGFEVELDVGLREQPVDQRTGAGRAALLAGLDQQGDRRVVGEAGGLEQLERLDALDYPALLVADAGAVEAGAVVREAPLRHGAGAEHGVDMADQQDARPAGAAQRRNGVGGEAGSFGGQRLDRHAQRLQPGSENRHDLRPTLGVAGAGVDVHDTFEQPEVVGLRRGSGGQQRVGGGGRCGGERQGGGGE